MLLSACLIAKNEAITLERCLTSLQGVADEIIVVDTGSTDNTVEIAERCGAKVYYFEWDNDFSHARNEAIQHASGEWILVIDADEYVDEEKAKGFRDFLSTTEAEGVFITVINYLGSLNRITKAMPIRVMRVFRNRHLYEGAVHEQIATSVHRSGRPVGNFDLVLHHVGYTEEFVKQRNKTVRNFELLEKELENDPDNLFHRSNLIAEYIIQGNWDKCYALAKETWDMISRLPPGDWPNYAARIYLHLVFSLWNTNQRNEAIEKAETGAKYFPWYTDMRKQYAVMLLDQGRWVEAKDELMKCREQGDTKSGLVEFTEGVGTYLAAQDLGFAWSLLGDDLVARRWLLQSFVENPMLESHILPLVSLLPHDPAFLHQHFESKIHDPVVFSNYTEAYASFGLAGSAELIERCVQRFGIREQTERAWASVYAMESREALERHVQHGNTELHWFWLGLYDLEQGDVERATQSFTRAGARGEYLIKIHHLLTTTTGSTWGAHLIIRDMATMRLNRTLADWLPSATDRAALWLTVKHSPVRSALTQAKWAGVTLLECEQNALRFFTQKEFDVASEWLNKAKSVAPTVTQVLLECDIALGQGNLDLARKVVYEGKKRFPESEAIKNASNLVHPKIDPVQLFQELKSKQTERSVLQ